MLAGCVESSAVQCDGFVCAEGKLCDNANQQCVMQSQFDDCAGMTDGMACSIGTETGFCSFEVCVATVCGDGRATGTERCDGTDLLATTTCKSLGWYNDANVTCNANCTINETMCEQKCGDGVINGAEYCERDMPGVELSCLDFGYDRGLITCSDFCQPDFSSCESFGFAPVNTGSSTRMEAVWGSSANDVWFVGLAGASHWDGTEWKSYTIGQPTDTILRAVWGSATNDVWAVGQDGVNARFDGTSWTRSSTPLTDKNLEHMWGSASNNIFAGGIDGTILQYDGASWTPMTSNTTYAITDLWGAGARDVYASSQANTGGDIHRYTGGSGWSSTQVSTTTGMRSVHGFSASDVWAIDDGSTLNGAVVYHKTTGAFAAAKTIAWAGSTNVLHAVSGSRVMIGANPDTAIIDNGHLWRVASDEIQDMWAASPTDVWGLTKSGSVRHFAGTAWLSDVNILVGGSPRDVDAMSAVGDTAFAYQNKNSAPAAGFFKWTGEGWLNIGASATDQVRAIHAFSETQVWAVGDGGLVRRFNNGWLASADTTGISVSLGAVFGLSMSDVWAVGDDGTIIHNNGSGWSAPHTVPAAAANVDLFRVWAADASTVYALGLVQNGNSIRAMVLKYAGGTTWTEVTIPSNPIALFAIWGTGPNNIYASGFGEVLHFDGTTWTTTPLGGQVSLYNVSGSGPNDIFIAGDGGVMYHYNGSRWAPMRTAGTANELRYLVVTPHHVFVSSGDETRVLIKP